MTNSARLWRVFDITNIVVPSFLIPVFSAVLIKNYKGAQYRYINEICATLLVSNIGWFLFAVCDWYSFARKDEPFIFWLLSVFGKYPCLVTHARCISLRSGLCNGTLVVRAQVL